MKHAIVALGILTLCGTALTMQPAKAGEVSRLNHDIQRLWDDTFDSHRDHDRRAWERRREAQRREWCRYHRDFDRCGPYYR
jgi:hypothetical protein